MVPAAVTLPLASTLNLDVPLACRSIKLPDGVPLVLLTKMKALAEPGLPEPVMVKVEPVLEPLSSFRTPESTADDVLEKAYRLPWRAVTAALEVSTASLLSLPATEV